jgi:hypothetical protein
MKRSGNHALINWINNDGNFFIVDNYIPKTYVMQGLLSLPQNRNIRSEILKQRFSACTKLNFKAIKPRKLISLEDYPPDYSPFKPDGEFFLNVFLVRRFKSLFASRLRKWNNSVDKLRYAPYSFENPKIVEENVRTWKTYAKLVLTLNNNPTPNQDGQIGVLFDSFLMSQRYRSSLRRALALSSKDGLPEFEKRIGGGSSFGQSNWSVKDLLQRDLLLTPGEREVIDSLWSDTEIQELDFELASLQSHLEFSP